jgi:hypothetical protein
MEFEVDANVRCKFWYFRSCIAEGTVFLVYDVMSRKDRILKWNLCIRAGVCVCVRASEHETRRPRETFNYWQQLRHFLLTASSGVIPFVIMSAFGSHSSLVGIATTLLAARSGADIPVGWRHFSPLQNVQTDSGASPDSGWIDTAVLPRG